MMVLFERFEARGCVSRKLFLIQYPVADSLDRASPVADVFQRRYFGMRKYTHLTASWILCICTRLIISLQHLVLRL